MRALVIIAVLVGCGDDDSGGGGSHHDAAPVDVPASSCDPSAVCSAGPQCGAVCCAAGEHCDNGTCMCGASAACLTGDYCVSGGPIAPAAGCGALCCGPVSGMGCPI